MLYYARKNLIESGFELGRISGFEEAVGNAIAIGIPFRWGVGFVIGDIDVAIFFDERTIFSGVPERIL
jgi:hypothetical protein